MVRIGVVERTHDRHSIGAPGKPGKEAAKFDARQSGGECADHTAVARGRIHLGVKCFQMGRTTLQPDPDDRGFTRERLAACPRTCSQQISEAEASGAEATYLHRGTAVDVPRVQLP